jgi:RIO-like serine/threonine protein kinase
MARGPLLISRRGYEARAGANLAKDTWHKPELRPVEVRSTPCLVKDYRRRPLLVRMTYGRAMVRREITVYRALRDLPGIPRLLGEIDAYAFVVERIDGPELGAFAPRELPPGFIETLEATVREMHERGVIHGDLRQRRNILVGPGGRPYLIDFASGIRLSPDFPLFGLLRQMDLSAVAKLKAKHAPETLTPPERRLITLERLRPFRRSRLRRREQRRLDRARRSTPSEPGAGAAAGRRETEPEPPARSG